MLFSLRLRKGQTSPLSIIKPGGSDKFARRDRDLIPHAELTLCHLSAFSDYSPFYTPQIGESQHENASAS
jgi:hypothetical protein